MAGFWQSPTKYSQTLELEQTEDWNLDFIENRFGALTPTKANAIKEMRHFSERVQVKSQFSVASDFNKLVKSIA